MIYDDIITALMYVDKLRTKDMRGVPQELKDNRDLILYANDSMKLEKGLYNPYYPLLKQGLNKQFELYVKPGWLEVIGKKEYKSVLDIGAGGGAYLNALSMDINKVAIDNKPMGNIKRAKLIKGKFPQDMNNNLRFDVILMNEFIHLHKPEVALELIAEAKKYLNPGGRLVVTENKYSEHLAYRLEKLGGGYIYNPVDFHFDEVYSLDRHWIGVMNYEKL